MPGAKVTYAVSILTFSSALLVYSKAGITEFFLPPTNAWSTRFQEDIREITIEAEQGNAFAQFDLGVVSGQQAPSRLGEERTTHLSA